MNNNLIHEVVDRYLNKKPIFLVTYFVDKSNHSIKPITINKIILGDPDSIGGSIRIKGEFTSNKGKKYTTTITDEYIDTIHALTIKGKYSNSRILECITVDGDFDEILEEMRTTTEDYDYSHIRSKDHINPGN